ncbi:SpvB/TcaC N-terminal domain-containing protein [Pseudomonas sp. CCC3.1]|uniref:SpvB/TcaC N-terminal domain-containing protein n=2 Tax=unclassified Pseudomonas TaxID=196821 RepID=UPI002AC9452F|nr:SpvB/TcaC N-terminal domain-containing protein [Pseudomonas sp. CCC3.1]MEB0204694.1 SpvB/TcaC N-terminal domain-containing protein [Pseudomonas sp. CCC3.1]WPX38612.1 SpvB/TcaC N-terminal domain-containing protein [Pseudomonas sp. CCC3.1]
MAEDSLSVSTPSLPKGGGAIQSIGKGWGAVGSSGAANCGLPLPLSAGRGYGPSLSLGYSSAAGNGLFGLGWALNLGYVARRTSKGVPTYTDEDVIVGPSGDVWLAERYAHGEPVVERITRQSIAYDVTRHYARAEGAFDRIEHWRPAPVKLTDPLDPGFWLVYSADGSQSVFGLRPGSRSTDPENPLRVGEWLLDETMNAHGEHVLYEYKSEDEEGLAPDHPRNFIAQCYLNRVRYGNFEAHDALYLWDEQTLNAAQWHFDLVLDYGERTVELTEKPTYEEETVWPVRSDPHSSFAYGFELGNLRLCRQVLMFHHFPGEWDESPRLVQRLLMNYETSPLSYNCLVAAHFIAYADDGTAEFRPPVEFTYSSFQLQDQHFTEFESMPGLNDGQQYQLLDLYGEGMPGVLSRRDDSWLYREPMRAESGGADQVEYGPWQQLPKHPVADSAKPVQQSLTDLTGDGKLDWIVAQPGLSGFFTLNPDRTWSRFATFAAFPQEFFHPQGQMADLIGAGLSDLALIGTRSVRLYANRREAGFSAALDVVHPLPDDNLPLLSDSRTEVVAFSDLLGTGQQHLVRIRHNEVRCWPNLGRGHFGKSFLLPCPQFAQYADFDTSRILLADLDGSGAADILYLTSQTIDIYMNQCGNGFADKQSLPWPEGVRYDNTCQVSTADLQGLGCSSLIFTSPHMSPRHWRCDFVQAKPYMLAETNNNMGAVGTVSYRSSAQEWLDEKQALLAAEKPAVSYLPFPMHVVTQQTQLDEITGNRLTQHFQYRQGFYDGLEREVRGFGLLIQTDTEAVDNEVAPLGYTAPTRTKTWFHTGRYPELAPEGYDLRDADARPSGPTLLSRYRAETLDDGEIQHHDDLIEVPAEAQLREVARTLSGSPLRVEVFGLEDADGQDVLYSVQHNRYLVRELIPQDLEHRQPYASMLALPLESISYQYDSATNKAKVFDPLCQHNIGLRWDAFGSSTQAVVIDYARRKTHGDLPPFDDEHQQRWWQAAHDDAQQFYYVNESRAQAIHLTTRDAWRLDLPYLSRSNALVLPPSELSPETLRYEALLDAADGPLRPRPERVLTGQAVQRYTDCEDGDATLAALVAFTETAELDETALGAYDRKYPDRDKLYERLDELGYVHMPLFLPSDGEALWSVRRGFATYGTAAQFYNILEFRPTLSHGLTTVTYDPYFLAPLSVTTPDGCSTVATYDYRTLQPWRIVDPNQNTQEVLFDAFGQLRASSFYGTELGEAIGFDPISTFETSIKDPGAAIESPRDAIKNAASASVYDAFSWMGRVPETLRSNKAWMSEHVASGDVMPSGHLCARARISDNPEWHLLTQEASREPVHSAVLVADRYPGDAAQQIRISLACFDGFGRTLQSKQKVEDGYAYAVDDEGNLIIENGKPIQLQDVSRWRVSERVEYNNKGLAVRVYQPYFADKHRYINDESFREFGYSDQQFYDSLGRPTDIFTARGGWRRQTYLTWYTISEDENDLDQEVPQAPLKAALLAQLRGRIK